MAVFAIIFPPPKFAIQFAVELPDAFAVVTATPMPGWSFLNWFGDASGINPIINISVTRNKYVQAVFGTLLTNSVFMSLYPQADFYPYGTTVKLTGLPPSGTYFVSWSSLASVYILSALMPRETGKVCAIGQANECAEKSKLCSIAGAITGVEMIRL